MMFKIDIQRFNEKYFTKLYKLLYRGCEIILSTLLYKRRRFHDVFLIHLFE